MRKYTTEISLEKNTPAKKPRQEATSSSAGLVSSSSTLETADVLNNSDCSLTASGFSTPPCFKTSLQPTLNESFRNVTEFAANEAKGIRLTNAILYMICKDSQSFQIVENDGCLDPMKVATPLLGILLKECWKTDIKSLKIVLRTRLKGSIA